MIPGRRHDAADQRSGGRHLTLAVPDPGGVPVLRSGRVRRGTAGPAVVSERDGAVSGGAVTVLTPRELDVLKLVAQGLSNPGIARRLVLSEHAVRWHLANILRKFSLSSRAAAAAWGVRTGPV